MVEPTPFPGVTRLDIPPETILKRAAAIPFTEVVVIGYDAEGMFYFAASKANGPDVLWLLEHAKTELMTASHEDLT